MLLLARRLSRNEDESDVASSFASAKAAGTRREFEVVVVAPANIHSTPGP